MTSDNNPPQSDSETRVDLGDDLLAEKTVVIYKTEPSPEKTPEDESSLSSQSLPDSLSETLPEALPEALEDQLESAKILMSEGLDEDAKKILRQILIKDPGHGVAKRALAELQELELKKIFRGEEARRYGRKPEQTLAEVDAEALMRQLDRDLNLGVFMEGVFVPQEGMSLFQDPEIVKNYCSRLELSLSSGTVRDWIDLGIAFLEMELYSIAVRLLTGACRRLNPDAPGGSELTLSATSLLALALVKAGRPFEALSRIQPIIQDVEIKRENKIELFYLMGRTYESMKKPEAAIEFYKQVIEIDPHYRDIPQRIRHLTGQFTGST